MEFPHSHQTGLPPNSAHDRYAGHETILVVDDDPAMCEQLDHMLAAYGYTVITARDATAATAIVERYPGDIDLLLADIMLPGLTGYELAARVVKLRPDLKTLYISGDHRRSLVVDGTVVHAGPFVPKPFTDTLMLRAIRDVLDAR